MKYRAGDRVKVSIDNDNENYDSFRDKVLIITDASNQGRGYDSTVYPQGLYCFEAEDGTEIPVSLYDYELERVE